jgi:hypothetical protein
MIERIGNCREDAVRRDARELIAAWLTDEEVAVELITRYPWARASESWVDGERCRLIGEGLDVPANGDLHRLMNLS